MGNSANSPKHVLLITPLPPAKADSGHDTEFVIEYGVRQSDEYGIQSDEAEYQRVDVGSVGRIDIPSDDSIVVLKLLHRQEMGSDSPLMRGVFAMTDFSEFLLPWEGLSKHLAPDKAYTTLYIPINQRNGEPAPMSRYQANAAIPNLLNPHGPHMTVLIREVQVPVEVGRNPDEAGPLKEPVVTGLPIDSATHESLNNSYLTNVTNPDVHREIEHIKLSARARSEWDQKWSNSNDNTRAQMAGSAQFSSAKKISVAVNVASATPAAISMSSQMQPKQQTPLRQRSATDGVVVRQRSSQTTSTQSRGGSMVVPQPQAPTRKAGSMHIPVEPARRPGGSIGMPQPGMPYPGRPRTSTHPSGPPQSGRPHSAFQGHPGHPGMRAQMSTGHPFQSMQHQPYKSMQGPVPNGHAPFRSMPLTRPSGQPVSMNQPGPRQVPQSMMLGPQRAF